LAQKKTGALTADEKRRLIDPHHPMLSINRQCTLLSLNRSTYYSAPASETQINLDLMRLIDEEYTRNPVNGRRRMTAYLNRQGFRVNVKRVRRLMQLMGLEAIYPKPNLSRKHPGHTIYPYLLRGYAIDKPNQVWSADITYIRMAKGFIYLTAIIDWYSRYVLSWRLSNTLDSHFCVEALKEALEQGYPGIFNTDQGVQYTSREFVSVLLDANVQISMDGKGRALDNAFVERLWRTVKHEHIYLHEYATVKELSAGLRKFFEFYNNERLHQSLGYLTPLEVHQKKLGSRHLSDNSVAC
jgi:putative transposase